MATAICVKKCYILTNIYKTIKLVDSLSEGYGYSKGKFLRISEIKKYVYLKLVPPKRCTIFIVIALQRERTSYGLQFKKNTLFSFNKHRLFLKILSTKLYSW